MKHAVMKMFLPAVVAVWAGLGPGCAAPGKLPPSPDPVIYEAVDSFQIRREALGRAIDSILSDTLLAQAGRSVYILSLDPEHEIYSLNRSSLMVPASVNKLFITGAAYRLLGIDHRFRTSVYGDSIGPYGRMDGDIYLKGFGDPDLMPADLEALAFRLKTMGLRTVRGNLVADAGYFDTTSFGQGWMWDEGPYAYNAPVSALSLNRNTFEIGLRPGSRPGMRPWLVVNPRTSYLELDNQAVTVRAGGNSKIKADRGFAGSGDVVTVTGTVAGDKGADYLIRTVTNPPLYCGTVFKEMLAASGIRVTGKVLEGDTPAGLPELTWHSSAPLHQIIREMNKDSDNFIAEMLYRRLTSGGDSLNGGRLAGFLGSLGFGEETFRLADGSGLSRYNLCSTEQLVRLLSEVYRDKNLRPELLSSLPIAGTDGTMARRLNAEEYKGMIRAKTGTLTGVSSLAGFVFGPQEKTYCFAIIFNNYTSRANTVRALQDSILARLMVLSP